MKDLCECGAKLIAAHGRLYCEKTIEKYKAVYGEYPKRLDTQAKPRESK